MSAFDDLTIFSQNRDEIFPFQWRHNMGVPYRNDVDLGVQWMMLSSQSQEISSWQVVFDIPISTHGPLVYRCGGKEYWILCDHRTGDTARDVIQYDVERNEYCVLTRYPKLFELKANDIVFISGQTDSQKLHLLSNSSNRCASCCLQSLEWSQHSITYVLDMTYYQGQTRRFDDDAVFTTDRDRVQCVEYDESTSKVKVSTIFGLKFKSHKYSHNPIMQWVPSMKALFIGNMSSKICKLWHTGNGMMSDIDIPFPMKERTAFPNHEFVYKYIDKYIAHCLVFGTMVLLVCRGIGKNFDIRCLDLVTQKWKRSQASIPQRIGGMTGKSEIRLMVSSDYYLHCLQYVDNMEMESTAHDYRKKLSAIIPHAFYEIYREREIPLILEYCRQKEEQFGLRPIPKDVTQIICNLYPVFG